MLAMKQAFPNTTDAEVGKPKVAKEVGGRKQLDNCMHKKEGYISILGIYNIDRKGKNI